MVFALCLGTLYICNLHMRSFRTSYFKVQGNFEVILYNNGTNWCDIQLDTVITTPHRCIQCGVGQSMCEFWHWKIWKSQFTRLIDSLLSPGLRIYAAVHAIPKERNISNILRHKTVGRGCMATYNVNGIDKGWITTVKGLDSWRCEPPPRAKPFSKG